jgi:dsRNA-specific ribonuclease
MEKTQFENVEIELNIQNLRDYFSNIRNDLGNKQSKRKKFDNWVRDLDTLLEQIEKIDSIVLPQLKDDLGYSFTDRNLVLIALIQPSVKKIFSEIKKEFNSTSDIIAPCQNLDFLEACPDRASSLAWIGDAAIKYAISSKIWKLKTSTEQLNDTRKMCESNENLSGLCEKWHLFDSRINLDPEDQKLKSANKIKGTLVEAIFGVIHLEKRIEGVQDALHLIHKSLK